MQRFLFLSMAVVSIASGCDKPTSSPSSGGVTSDDVRRDAGNAIDTAAEFSQHTKDEFQSKLNERLTQLDQEIVVLREKGSVLKDDAKARWEERLVNLESKREAARVKLAEVKDSSVEAWKDLQKGAQSAWSDLDTAFREASSEF